MTKCNPFHTHTQHTHVVLTKRGEMARPSDYEH